MSDQIITTESKNRARSTLKALNLLGENKRALWPLLALVIILTINWLISPDFFSVRLIQGRLSGSIIDVFNRGAPVMLLAMGMSLVIATKGIDLSVGAVIAICGAVAAVLVSTTDIHPLLVIAISIGAGVVCGLWNGILVAFFDIQPIVATLILMVAGRGIAQMITQGQIAIFNNETLAFVGTGLIFGIPFPVYLSFGVLLILYLFVRRTALGLLIESVGANDRASYYAGVNASMIKLLVYGIAGLCAAFAGLILTADIRGADANNAGLWLELDAILAVALGGAVPGKGGRFSLVLSVIGALIIQSVETGILLSGLPPTFNLIVKALVIMAVLLIQSDAFRHNVSRVFLGFRRTA
ncbi:MAG: ABC transporter permease [Anaerolineae bacterium]|nr:ABC transporter permease [Anaerolineae bacterium]